MVFDIKTKDENGDVSGEFKMNSTEASLVLTVGLNYLMANGVMPLFTGKDDVELGIMSATPEQVQ